MKSTSFIALGGILTALSIFIMFWSSVFPVLAYTLPAFAGALLLIMVKEAEKKWSIMVYIAVGILSLIVVSNKEAVVLYIFFFGYYSILKEVIENRFTSIIKWIFKLIVFNISIVLAFIVIIYVFAVPIEELEEYGKYSAYIMLGAGNIIFIIYDYALTNLMIIYDDHWHKRFKKIFK